MPSINLSYVNVALDSLGLIVALIIFFACLGEWISKRAGSRNFIWLLGLVSLALLADAVGWVGEGHPDLSVMTTVANTVAFCAGQLAIICFMEYLCRSLYANSRGAMVTLNIFRVLCVGSLAYSIGNAFLGYAFEVNRKGHYVSSGDTMMVVLHLSFSIMSFCAIILMALFAHSSTRSSRASFIIYTLFPIAGIIIDHSLHGISLTYVSIVISILVIYTNIYLQRQRMIDAQKNALMLSQINPHFTYNTLSTIAAMCDSSPHLAKSLTIDFSRYLRKNIDAMMSEGNIPFEKEIEHVECYLKIEKARFREKLNVLYSFQCRNFNIPPLTVQPIVENAVKHGITKNPGGGTIKISTYDTGKAYVVEIIDDGVGFDTEAVLGDREGHVGLENVESRVRRMCRGSVSVKSTVGIGTRVTIEIPHKKGKKNEHSGC